MISPVSVPTIPTTLAPMLAAVSDVAITHKHTVSQNPQKFRRKIRKVQKKNSQQHLNIRLELNF